MWEITQTAALSDASFEATTSTASQLSTRSSSFSSSTTGTETNTAGATVTRTTTINYSETLRAQSSGQTAASGGITQFTLTASSSSSRISQATLGSLTQFASASGSGTTSQSGSSTPFAETTFLSAHSSSQTASSAGNGDTSTTFTTSQSGETTTSFSTSTSFEVFTNTTTQATEDANQTTTVTVADSVVTISNGTTTSTSTERTSVSTTTGGNRTVQSVTGDTFALTSGTTISYSSAALNDWLFTASELTASSVISQFNEATTFRKSETVDTYALPAAGSFTTSAIGFATVSGSYSITALTTIQVGVTGGTSFTRLPNETTASSFFAVTTSSLSYVDSTAISLGASATCSATTTRLTTWSRPTETTYALPSFTAGLPIVFASQSRQLTTTTSTTSSAIITVATNANSSSSSSGIGTIGGTTTQSGSTLQAGVSSYSSRSANVGFSTSGGVVAGFKPNGPLMGAAQLPNETTHTVARVTIGTGTTMGYAWSSVSFNVRVPCQSDEFTWTAGTSTFIGAQTVKTVYWRETWTEAGSFEMSTASPSVNNWASMITSHPLAIGGRGFHAAPASLVLDGVFARTVNDGTVSAYSGPASVDGTTAIQDSLVYIAEAAPYASKFGTGPQAQQGFFYQKWNTAA